VRAALLLAAVGLPALAFAGSPDLVAEGERWWTKSPDPANPVACATCHWDPAATRGWAASFTLPAGSLQAVRANFRYTGSASSCSTGAYDDHDDLVFAVGP